MLLVTPDLPEQVAGSTRPPNAFTFCLPIALMPGPSRLPTSTRCGAIFIPWPLKHLVRRRKLLNQPNNPPNPVRRADRFRDFFSLERNVVVASGAVFLLGFGEELWKRYLPKYLQALGASIPVIGLFGTAEDFFDAVYQYPGGWIADRFGRRRAFFVFLSLACVGYLVYLLGPSWPFAFVGLAFVMAWQSMASPAIFAVIGDALPKERRAMGFSIQSILKRAPIVIAPVIAGMIIASHGIALRGHL